jgi:DNA invertase Pin-like site-specific DNA recombinase
MRRTRRTEVGGSEGLRKREGGNGEGGRPGAAVGYARRSTDRQEQSIPDQQRAIERFCEQRGLRLLRWYIDDAISGTSSEGRKGFQALIADAQQRGCDFSSIVCYDVKRFGRVDNDEAGYYRHVLRASGVQVLYASENFAGDGTDDLLRPVKQWQAREESKDLSKVTIRGLVTKSTTGHWMGGAPPFGFDLRYESQSGEFLFYLRYHPDGSKAMFDKKWTPIRTLRRGETVAVSRRDHCRLVPSEKSRVNTVRRIYSLYIEDGIGFKGIADRLNREKVPPARGPAWAAHYSGQWAMTTVRAILINPAYAGDMVWNRRTDARFHRIKSGLALERKDAHARRLALNDPADWAVVREAHPAIISRRLFELARTRIEAKPASSEQRGIDQRRGAPAGCREHRKVGDVSGPRARFLLSKLVTCAKCGSRYEGYTMRGAKRLADGGLAKRYFYACGGYIRRGPSVCSLGAVPQEQFEEAVIESVVGYYARYQGEEGRTLLARAIREQLGMEEDEVGRSRERLAKELERVERATRRLLDNITPATRAAVERRLSELEEERAEVAGRLESLEQLALSKAELRELVEETGVFLAGLEVALREGPLERRQGALRRCVQSVAYSHDGRNAGIELRVVPGLAGLSVQVLTESMRTSAL